MALLMTGCDFQDAASALHSALAAGVSPTPDSAFVALPPPASPSPMPLPTARPKPSPTPAPTATALAQKPLSTLHVMAIGDSVMLGARPALLRVMPALQVDAVVSRQVGAGIAILRARKAAGTLADIVVFHLGTNGSFFQAQMDDLLRVLDGRKVVFVNLKVPRVWEGSNNAVITKGVARDARVALADWHAASAGHPEFFARDGFHLTTAGAQVYAGLIADALRRLSAQ